MADLDGRVCLVTGASDGIGKETAIGLARRGATVVMVGRNADKTRAAADDVKQKAGRGAVQTLIADLSSQKEVRRLADDFRARHDRLHVLVNNAGGIFLERHTTVDGLEMTFALDHLNYFLLTHLLLDVLKASAPARVVNVASAAHLTGRIEFDDLQLEKDFGGMRAYGQAKLANIMFTYELARRLEGSGVTANCLHPGAVSTGFAQNNKGVFAKIVRFAGPLLRTPEKGARTSVYLAAEDEVAGVNGRYFIDCRARSSSKRSYDVEVQKRLWAESEKLVGLA